MRYTINPQLQIGETLIEDIQFDIHSRDDIPQVLRGLQQIYKDTKTRDIILEQIGTVIIAETDPDTCNGLQTASFSALIICKYPTLSAHIK